MTLHIEPKGLPVHFRPGQPYTLVLTWPTDLTGRTFEATLDDEELGVDVDGFTLTLTLTGEQTAEVAGPQLSTASFTLTDTTTLEPVVMLVGHWYPTLRGADSPVTTEVAVTTTTDVQVSVTLLGGAGASLVAVAEETARAQAAEAAEVTARGNAVTAEAAARAAGDAANAAALTVEAATARAAEAAKETPAGAQAKADAAQAAAQAASIPVAQKGAASGVATLDAGGKIPTGQIPALAITDTFVVASQAAMLALTAEKGDVAVRTDFTPNRAFILAAADPTILGNWQALDPATTVTSVNGATGVVTGLASTSDVAAEAALRIAGDAASQPLDADLTAIAGSTTEAYGRGLLTTPDAPAARAALGIFEQDEPPSSPGVGDFWLDTDGEPPDPTIIETGNIADGAVTPVKTDGSFLIASRNLDDIVSPSTARANLGLGTAATMASTLFDAAGAAAAAQAASQPLDSDLTAIAALVSAANKMLYATGAGTWALADLTAAGRALIDDPDAPAQLVTLGVAAAIAAAVPALLTECSDNNATQQNPAATTSWAAVDATKLPAVTFTVPADGVVEIEYGAFAFAERTTGNTFLQWGVLESGSIVAASILAAVLSADNGIMVASRVRSRIKVTGLTPGASKTWTWAHRYVTSATGLAFTSWGGSDTTAYGPARLRIHEAAV